MRKILFSDLLGTLVYSSMLDAEAYCNGVEKEIEILSRKINDF